jgi:hypothetical protein
VEREKLSAVSRLLYLREIALFVNLGALTVESTAKWCSA